MNVRAVGCPRGFTFPELIVVIGVIGVVAAVSIPPLSNAVARNRVFTSSELLAAQIREARLAAITRNRTFRVVFDCPDGAVRSLVVTGIPSIDDSPDRCMEAQPNDGAPVFLAPAVSLGNPLPPNLLINSRGQISAQNGAPMPRSLSVSYENFTRTLVVTSAGRISTPGNAPQ